MGTQRRRKPKLLKSFSEANDEKLLAGVLRDHRRRLEGAHSLGKGTTPELLNRKRFARTKLREIKKKLFAKSEPLRNRLKGIPKRVWLASYSADPLMDALLSNRESQWIPISQRTRHRPPRRIEIRDFSFIDNPHGTMKSLGNICRAEMCELDTKIDFLDEDILDIGPYLLLVRMWDSMANVFSGGLLRVSAQKVIEAVGLRKHMQMAEFPLVQGTRDIWSFPIRYRSPPTGRWSTARLIAPQTREIVTDDFTDWVDGCLYPVGQELTDDGKGWVANILTEIFDNAERHSNVTEHEGNWSIAGFMARRKDGDKHVYVLSLAFLSIGLTISQSMDTCLDNVKVDMAKYGRNAARSGMSEDTYRTVFALQDGVTRVADADEHNRGGIGFQEIIDLVNDLGVRSASNQKPRLTIISGRSCIQVAEPYIRGQRLNNDANNLRELWFNESNDRGLPPSPDHAYDLDVSLPGTLISLRLVLDPDHVSDTNVNE